MVISNPAIGRGPRGSGSVEAFFQFAQIDRGQERCKIRMTTASTSRSCFRGPRKGPLRNNTSGSQLLTQPRESFWLILGNFKKGANNSELCLLLKRVASEAQALPQIGRLEDAKNEEALFQQLQRLKEKRILDAMQR
jgi:hypothetical protein